MISAQKELPKFSEKFFESEDHISCIGSGEPGGKAKGLVFIN